MPVYVDSSRNNFGRMVMCHMIADTAEELHEMAQLIGMQRRWFQTLDAPKPASFPHYDVSLSRRRLAIENGVLELVRREFVMRMRIIRERMILDPSFAESWRY